MSVLVVRKLSAQVMVAVDDDGTPLAHGERMVEAEPGHWQSPTLVAVLKFLSHQEGDEQ